MSQQVYDQTSWGREHVVMYTGGGSYTRPRRRYGFFKFLFDCFMVLLTGGLWFIWIFVREMRR